ncbi:hypothetical protein [Paenarthrobacter sp. YIM B13468]|jgi:hypothetical protein|uniref:biotin synthase auxiliary protein BsaP n=1 Tax=Paenarthrobacter sp. YIM B13468 TaxID=3366295 RepID=UPI00366F0898
MTAIGAMQAEYCGHCGGTVAGALFEDVVEGAVEDGTVIGGGTVLKGTNGERPTSHPHSTSDSHQGCQQRLAMEPPRYCAQCRRRMKVQVTPLGWSAECSRHGRVSR